MLKNNIVLIGFRGTGKSSIAKMLSKKLKFQLICIDDEIIKFCKKPISEIVQNKGWNYFRKIESKILYQLINRNKLIVDTGGGIIQKKENRSILGSLGFITLLTSTKKDIYKRINSDNERPSLTKKDLISEIDHLLIKRKKLYNSLADFKISTSENNIVNSTDKIIKSFKFYLEKYGK